MHSLGLAITVSPFHSHPWHSQLGVAFTTSLEAHLFCDDDGVECGATEQLVATYEQVEAVLAWRGGEDVLR
jgi:hypothetical protein